MSAVALRATPLAQMMAAHGMTARQLARRVGVNEHAAQAWATGKHRPKPHNAFTVARVLHTTVEDLWPGLLTAALRAEQHHPKPDRPGWLSVDEVLDLPATHSPRWHTRALCHTEPHHPDLWWPSPSADGDEARRICARCPVITACRDDFLAHPYPDRSCIIAGVKGTDLLRAAHNRRRAVRRRNTA